MDVDLSAPILLDGATATNLFESGAVPENICLERWILEHPQKLIDLQKKYLEIGSKLLYTPSFGANAARLARFGLEDRVASYNKQLAKLTLSIANNCLVAGGLSSTGLILEPFGDTSFTEMIAIYREQASALLQAGVDLFVVETLTSVSEARAAAIALKKFDKPVIITLTVDEDGEMPFGGTALNAMIMLQELGIAAFGLNCSYGPKNMAKVIQQLRPYAKIPLVAKPAAVAYQEETKQISPLTPIEMAMETKQILNAGATLIGGCCGTTPQHLDAIQDAMYEHNFNQTFPQQDWQGDIILADTKQIYCLYCDQIECSPALKCSVDMTDELLALEEESYDVILIEVNSPDDARDFSKNAHIATLPICFLSHDEAALRLALMLYNGRAMIDSHSSIEMEKLEKIAAKYGAVIY